MQIINKRVVMFSIMAIMAAMFLSVSDTFAQTTRYDFDGDGKTDPAIFRQTLGGADSPGGGEWFVLRSENPSSFYSFSFGLSTDFPVVGDYDGDGIADAAVWRNTEGVWYIQQSRDGFKAISFGAQNDVPVDLSRLAD